jgi:PTS system ascorbate-specific IIA component
MSVSLLIITHNDIGKQLLNTATNMLETCPLKAVTLSIEHDTDPDISLARAKQVISEINEGDGILVLTDMYGSTPSNIANRLLSEKNINVIAGINLPMLIRILNYPGLDLDDLTNKAISGGKDGVLPCGHGTAN